MTARRRGRYGPRPPGAVIVARPTGRTMTMLTLAGETFHVRVDGPADAPALILSNSLSSDLSMWDDQVPAWARRYRVIRYDHRGHGASVAPAGAYSFDQLGR